MDYIKEININEAVIHILDNNADEPILNEFGLSLTEDTYWFLYKHISKALKDDGLKYGKFNESSELISCNKYLTGHEDIISSSKEIARQMFAIMKSKGNVPSCDLIVASISTEYGPMLAVLKMDYVNEYKHEIEFVENRIGINIKKDTTLLDSKKIKKCAFIKLYDEKSFYNILFLNKVNRTGKKEEDWFIDNFLDCSLVENDRDNTKGLYDLTEYFIRNNLTGDAVKAEKARRVLREKLKQEKINTELLTKDLFESEKYRKNFIEILSKNDIKDFKVCKEWVENKFKKINLKTDNGIEVKLDEELYKDINNFEIKNNVDGTINIVIKNIADYIEK